MKRIAIVGLAILGSEVALAEATVVSRSGLLIKIGGEIEYEFVDVEGKGGFSNTDGSTLRPSQRSPYIAMDEASLKFDVIYSENLELFLKYKFSGSEATLDISLATYKLPDWGARIEFGKDEPIVAPSRKTESYPLIGTAFWKGRENHVAFFKNMDFGEQFKTEIGLSVGPKRQFGSDDVAEDKSFKMLVYDDFEAKDGQSEEWGLSLKGEYEGILAQGFYYQGRLIDDFDWKTSLSQAISDYDSLGDETDKTHYWYGSRLEYNNYNVHFRTEYIKSKDGLLPRVGQYHQVSYQFLDLAGTKVIEPLFRYDVLNVDKVLPVNGNSLTWDREMKTYALLVKHTDFITSKIEYYDINERTGNKASNKPVVDDQFVYQFNLSF